VKPALTILSLFCFLSFSPATTHAQNSDTARIARIEPDSIALAPLIYLASDELKGRHIGGAGIAIAANYIVSRLRAAGAQPVPGTTSYFQVFTKNLSRHDLVRVGQSLRYNMPGFEYSKNFTLKNIVAFIPGIYPTLREQYIMLSAHYDHIGIADYPTLVDGKLDSIFNGARDNATGVAAVIAAARYFGKYPPKRSVLLVLFTAEEEGEFGSDYYTDNPLVPLNKTIFDLNVDNAGYNTTNAICLFGLGLTSADSLIQKACLEYNLAVLAEPPGLQLFERSDNYNLARIGVPAPCFSMGMKSWDKEIDQYYHRLGDQVENMDLSYVVRFIRAYILSAKYIADDPQQPIWLWGDEYKNAWLNLYARPSHLNPSPQHAVLPPPAHP
jgi:Peptidase family M28